MNSYLTDFIDENSGDFSPRAVAGLAELNDAGIPYAVWKSLENLEAQFIRLEGDIDLLFLDGDYPRVAAVLAGAGFVEDFYSPSARGRDIRVFRSFDASKSKPVMFHAYFKCRFGKHPTHFFVVPNHDMMLDRRVLYRNVFFLSELDFASTRVLSHVFKGCPSDSLIERLLVTMKNSRDARSPGINLPVLDALDQVGAWDEGLDQNQALLRRRLLDSANVLFQKTSINERFLSVIRAKLRFLTRHNKLRLPAIFLIGADGSGKTTASKLVQNHLLTVGGARRVYLGRGTEQDKKQDRKESSLTKMLPGLARLKSARLLIQFLRVQLLSATGVVVVADRSLLDEYVKLTQSNYRILRGWGHVLGFLSKMADNLYFLLECDPETAATRTKNVTGREIWQRQAELRRALEEKTISHRRLDTSTLSPEQVAGEIIFQSIPKSNRSSRVWL